MEELVNATLEDLAYSYKGIHQQGDLPSHIGENKEGDREYFHFYNEEQSREEHDNNENVNSEGEEYFESKNEEEEENEDMAND